MADEAEAAGEYERLRAELADFVMDALAERIAAGGQPRLSQALVEAIDRRVDEAVAARLASAEWPDPDAFADSVIAAAAGRGGGEEARPRGRRIAGSSTSTGRREPPRSRRMSNGQIMLIALVAVAVVAAAAYFFLRSWNAPATNTVVMNVQGGNIEPTPDGGTNVQQLPPGNVAAAPVPANPVQNVPGQNP